MYFEAAICRFRYFYHIENYESSVKATLIHAMRFCAFVLGEDLTLEGPALSRNVSHLFLLVK